MTETIQPTTSGTTASSINVVGAAFEGQIERVSSTTLDPIAFASSVPPSVSPVDLNEGAQVSHPGLQDSAKSALAESRTVRPIGSIPTADFVRSGSYKDDNKFIVRIASASPSGAGDKQKTGLEDGFDEINPNFYFDKASLQAVNESSEEKYQLFEGFDGNTLFLFGQRPRIWSFQLMVLNGKQPFVSDDLRNGSPEVLKAYLNQYNMDFANQLIRRYDRYYRGTKCLSLRARCYMTYEDVLIEGTLVAMSAARNSQIPGAVSMMLTAVIHSYVHMGEEGSVDGDATLTELQKSKSVADAFKRNVSPTRIVPAKKTIAELQQDHASTQAAAGVAQDSISRQLREASDLGAASASSATSERKLNDQLVALAAAIATTTDPAERASLRAQEVEIQTKLNSLKAFQQEAQALKDAKTSTPTKKKESDSLAEAQRAKEDQLRHSAGGDQTSTTGETTTIFIEIIVRQQEVDQQTVETKTAKFFRGPEGSYSPPFDSIPGFSLIETKDVTNDQAYVGKANGDHIKEVQAGSST